MSLTCREKRTDLKAEPYDPSAEMRHVVGVRRWNHATRGFTVFVFVFDV
jgi:hypothetical protein